MQKKIIMVATTIHLFMALALFLIQNWIGSKSYSRGYVKFSLLDDKDEALSFNFVIKVFGPIVYLIIMVAKLLQKSEMRKDIVIELSYKGFG